MRQYSFAIPILSHSPLFRDIDPACIPDLLGDAASVSTYEKGAVLLDSTADTQALAFLLEGSALVYKAAGDGRRVLMSRLTQGSVYGMASLFHAERFPARIQAERSCSALIWPKDAVEMAFSLTPQLSRNYIGLLSERIAFLNRRIETLIGEDPRARLLHLLHSMQDASSMLKEDGGVIHLPYAFSQLAELLGIGRASLYRALDSLEAEGIIQRHGRVIRLTQPTTNGVSQSNHA